MTIATLITNNAYDALIIEDEVNGSRMHRIDSARTFLDALTIGDAQNIDNWSGEPLDDGVTPADCGEVIATNDGTTLTVIDHRLMARRHEFWVR